MGIVVRSIARWCRAVGLGLYRSAVLVGLSAVVPAAVAAVAFFGGEFALSWTAHLVSPLTVRLLADAGEILIAAVWTAAAVRLSIAGAGRPLSQAARTLTGQWLGPRIEARYAPPTPIIRMSTGFWWNGSEYYPSEWEARWHAQFQKARDLRDPQARRDAIWIGVAAGTVLPVAALPLLGLAAGIWMALTPGLLGLGIALVVAGLAAALFAWRILGPLAPRFLGPAQRSRVEERVEELEAVQADMTQTQAAELERIERGLHDGAQARLIALGLSMGAAEQLVDTDPAAAKALLAEARGSAAAALDELRSLVCGINPPVLSERGLADAVRALALDAPVRVAVTSQLPSRPERPVESALYFAISELLVNVAKHAGATEAGVCLRYDGRSLRATVTDDGRGGATVADGSGLRGIERRMAALRGSCGTDWSACWRRTGTRWSRRWARARRCWARCWPVGRTSPSSTSACRHRSPTRGCRRPSPPAGRYRACPC
jgi:signal transduction histidine kinase